MSYKSTILCLFAVLLQWQLWSVASAIGLVPPRGYSVGFTGTIAKGSQTYVCNRGSWTRTGSSSNLYAQDGSKLGTYRSVYNAKTRVVTYYWNIINSAGGYYESGQSISGLQATLVKSVRVSSSAIPEYLAIVKVHRGSGDASQVAFVSLTRTKGGLPPRKALCASNGATSGVPFGGTFKFYNQDREPPRMPASITPKATFVQVVFLEGKVTYKFTGGKWVYQGIFATIAEVAGGNALGKFGTATRPDRYGSKTMWQFKGPSGYWLSGQMCTRPVRMDVEGLPWQLLKITTSGGAESPMGKYTYALVGGTLGGLAPRLAPRASGMTWSSPFTAQCYLYVA